MEMFDESDKQAQFYYGPGFKSWRQEVEGVEEFLAELISKKKILSEERSKVQGNTIIKTIKSPYKELDDS